MAFSVHSILAESPTSCPQVIVAKELVEEMVDEWIGEGSGVVQHMIAGCVDGEGGDGGGPVEVEVRCFPSQVSDSFRWR